MLQEMTCGNGVMGIILHDITANTVYIWYSARVTFYPFDCAAAADGKLCDGGRGGGVDRTKSDQIKIPAGGSFLGGEGHNIVQYSCILAGRSISIARAPPPRSPGVAKSELARITCSVVVSSAGLPRARFSVRECRRRGRCAGRPVGWRLRRGHRGRGDETAAARGDKMDSPAGAGRNHGGRQKRPSRAVIDPPPPPPLSTPRGATNFQPLQAYMQAREGRAAWRKGGEGDPGSGGDHSTSHSVSRGAHPVFCRRHDVALLDR